MAENGDYDGAIEAFADLGSYKDSEYRVKETTYKKADKKQILAHSHDNDAAPYRI